MSDLDQSGKTSDISLSDLNKLTTLSGGIKINLTCIIIVL
jgi:hypothetical protein